MKLDYFHSPSLSLSLGATAIKVQSHSEEHFLQLSEMAQPYYSSQYFLSVYTSPQISASNFIMGINLQHPESSECQPRREEGIKRNIHGISQREALSLK